MLIIRLGKITDIDEGALLEMKLLQFGLLLILLFLLVLIVDINEDQIEMSHFRIQTLILLIIVVDRLVRVISEMDLVQIRPQLLAHARSDVLRCCLA
jgi:hypothetical protein